MENIFTTAPDWLGKIIKNIERRLYGPKSCSSRSPRTSSKSLGQQKLHCLSACHVTSKKCPSIDFFLEKVRAKYTFYFKLLRDSPIDQIVQTVFGYSLRKE